MYNLYKFKFLIYFKGTSLRLFSVGYLVKFKAKSVKIKKYLTLYNY